MMRYVFTITILTMLAVAGTLQAGEQTNRILLIGKDRDHPYGTHEYMTECKLLANCLKQTSGIETVVSNGWPKDETKLKDVKAIVLYTRNGADVVLKNPAREQFLKMMKNGVGLTAIHWSTGASDKLHGEQYLHVLGGWFSRPLIGSTLAITTTKLKQAAPDHPICKGWKAYDLRDEYYLGLQFLPKIKPVMTVNIKDKEHTVGWVYERPDSKHGRSFGFVCGHFHANFGESDFRKAIVNGILWTAHREVPEAGASVKITPDDLKLPPKGAK